MINSFNAVFELLRRKHKVPKGLWHFVVELVRPRAPLVLEKWDRWTRTGRDIAWYEWRSRKIWRQYNISEITVLTEFWDDDITPIFRWVCGLCLKRNISRRLQRPPLCDECLSVLQYNVPLF